MSLIFDTIVKSIKITDYLSSKNIKYDIHNGNRYRYKCPLPGHKKDNTPSFFVYDKSDRQDFCCFGCKTSGSIIQLVSAYEQKSIKDTVKKLADGLNINIDDVIDTLLREIISTINSEEKSDKSEQILSTSLFIGVHIHDFLVKVNFDSEELVIAEKVFSLVDSLVKIQNIDELEQLSLSLPLKTKQRYQMYLERVKSEEIQNLKRIKLYAD